MRKIKVLIISNISKKSGAEIVLERFIENNNEICPIFLLPEGELHDLFVSQGYKVFRSFGLNELSRNRNKIWILIFMIRFIYSFFEILISCIRAKPDIIHLNNFTAGIYCIAPIKLMRKKIIWHIHDIFLPESLEGKVYKVIGNHFDCIVAVSNSVKDNLIKCGIREKKIRIVYNGVDGGGRYNPTFYQKKNWLAEKYGLRKNVVKIGIISLITEWKGIHFFIEALEMLPQTNQWRAFIIGDSWNTNDPYKDMLHEMVREKKLNNTVNFTGRIINIPPILNELDILVHASIKEDPFPTVVLEGMAMGKVVMATNCGGVPEMIDNMENGFLWECGKSDELYRLLLECISSKSNNEKMGRLAREKVLTKFTEDQKVNTINNIYHELVKKNHHY